MKILVTEPKDINGKAVTLLKSQKHEVVTRLSNDDKKNIEALLIRTLTICDKDYIGQFPNLKYILRVGVGLDNIDMEECKRRSIEVINAPGSNANAVAEYVIGLMIMASRNFSEQSENLHNKRWRDMNLIGQEIKGKTVGIVGCGAIGQLVAKKIKGFDVEKILGYDPFLTEKILSDHGIIKSSLEDLISESDYITLHLPLIPQTKKMFSASQFSMMKKNPIFVNTSRGGIVDEEALINALNSKIIRAAAIDVFENEPQINKKLLELKNLIATPHIAALTEEADEEMALAPVKKFLAIIADP